MWKIVRNFLMILGVNFLFVIILQLMNNYNIVSYTMGICAMGLANIIMEWRLYK